MKKIICSSIAILALGSCAFAGGDISPVEETVTPVVTAGDDSGFYLGGAYSYINYDLTKTVNSGGTRSTAERDTNHNAFMLQGGYQYNQYISFEGRYWWAGDEDFTLAGGRERTKTLDAWGIYVKPMYPVTEAFDIYALLGYAHIGSDFIVHRLNGTTKVQNLDDGGFSWGLGLSYDINENFSVFADFVRIYDDEQTKYLAFPLTGSKDWDMTIDSYNFGVTYKF